MREMLRDEQLAIITEKVPSLISSPSPTTCAFPRTPQRRDATGGVTPRDYKAGFSSEMSSDSISSSSGS